MKFSVVIIAYNEAHRLEKLLSSIQGADEVILIDSMSTDATEAVAKKWGAKVMQKAFVGFGQQKQFGVEQASNDWILSLDADEVPESEFWSQLQKLNPESDTNVYAIRRQLVFMGKVFRFGKESRDEQVRFFHRQHAHWSTPEVHEKIIFNGPKKQLTGKVAHYSFESLANYIGKFNRYTSLAADELIKKKKSRSPFLNGLLIPFNFFKFYVIQGNWLNGYPGFCWSLLSSVYPFVKHAKAHEVLHSSN